MAVKGYTREEMKEALARKRMMAVKIVAVLLVVLVAVNVALTIASVGMLAAMVSAVLFVFLWANFSKAINALEDEALNAKPYMIFRWAILVVYLASFVLAMFS